MSDKEFFNYLSDSFSDLSKYIIAVLIFILVLVTFITVIIIKVQKRKNDKLFNILNQQGIDFANQFRQQDMNFKTKLNAHQCCKLNGLHDLFFCSRLFDILTLRVFLFLQINRFFQYLLQGH